MLLEPFRTERLQSSNLGLDVDARDVAGRRRRETVQRRLRGQIARRTDRTGRTDAFRWTRTALDSRRRSLRPTSRAGSLADGDTRFPATQPCPRRSTLRMKPPFVVPARSRRLACGWRACRRTMAQSGAATPWWHLQTATAGSCPPPTATAGSSCPPPSASAWVSTSWARRRVTGTAWAIRSPPHQGPAPSGPAWSQLGALATGGASSGSRRSRS